mmetsp:Transcript_8897/g.21997  ORF Transcript_8897/g.21997 Transcript_8897/m.21997 type:complete len:118 (+) Transcript_8897:2339-2692(+)
MSWKEGGDGVNTTTTCCNFYSFHLKPFTFIFMHATTTTIITTHTHTLTHTPRYHFRSLLRRRNLPLQIHASIDARCLFGVTAKHTNRNIGVIKKHKNTFFYRITKVIEKAIVGRPHN